MYRLDIYRFSKSNEYEYKYAGKYGAKGEGRRPRRKPTPEQIRRQNQLNREKNMRRLIKANFRPYDLWSTLKYPRGTRKSVKEVKKDLKNFLDTMRRGYRKQGEELKFIYRMEIGERGGIHIHILVNRIRGQTGTDLLLTNAWKPGRVHFESIRSTGDYRQLANYIVKQPNEEEQGQMRMFEEKEKAGLIRYSSSRNLIRPRPERKIYSRRTVRKLIEEGPTPISGYYIDRDSIRQGVNPYTGMSYYQYTECRLDTGREWQKEVDVDADG